MPGDPEENVEGVPIDLPAQTPASLATLRTECLKINALVLSSSSFQWSAKNYFSSGVPGVIPNVFFSTIIEKLLALQQNTSDGIPFWKFPLITADNNLLRTALDAFLSVLPLPLVSEIVIQFLQTQKDPSVI